MPHDSQPLVSIIIPTRNEEEDIARTMDALVAFTYDPLEVVVVDASEDRTPEIVRSYANRLERLKLVPQGDKPGVSVARKEGKSQERGEPLERSPSQSEKACSIVSSDRIWSGINERIFS